MSVSRKLAEFAQIVKIFNLKWDCVEQRQESVEREAESLHNTLSSRKEDKIYLFGAEKKRAESRQECVIFRVDFLIA